MDSTSDRKSKYIYFVRSVSISSPSTLTKVSSVWKEHLSREILQDRLSSFHRSKLIDISVTRGQQIHRDDIFDYSSGSTPITKIGLNVLGSFQSQSLVETWFLKFSIVFNKFSRVFMVDIHITYT